LKNSACEHVKRIYVAGPLFSEHERTFLELLVKQIAVKLELDPEKDIFLPHRDAGDIGIHGEKRDTVFEADLQFLDNCDLVIALLDGSDVDSGTAVEMGYAYSRGKAVFGILTDWRRWSSPKREVININNMIWGICGKGKRIFREIDDKFIKDVKKALKDE
jgi:nucleoside 2-deoxyribosyltransferase